MRIQEDICMECGSDDVVVRVGLSEMSHGETVKIVECNQCDAVFEIPIRKEQEDE